jgi:hypothetical protein
MRAMAPSVGERYQRAGELLDDLLAARSKWAGTWNTRAGGPRSMPRRPAAVTEELQDIHGRLRAREAPAARFCWHCRKPLHSRTDRCPFCGEAQ